ncbi:MAG TPA: HAD hydrolase family protein, partial [Candidatus Omnitrophota bacterium]|nr:HAD hydrolase family protein [Candidatus Omnitrophota bacterium]
DGKIIYDSDGRETKNFDVQDGFGIVFFQQAGFKTAIITARASKVVTIRAKDLKINRIYQNAFPKIYAYRRMLADFKLKDDQVCFIGDDLVDIPILKRVGFAVAVSNAVEDVKQVTHYVTKKKGGNGAVREVIDLILKTTDNWKAVMRGLEGGLK